MALRVPVQQQQWRTPACSASMQTNSIALDGKGCEILKHGQIVLDKRFSIKQ
jgi:hypothetical protein